MAFSSDFAYDKVCSMIYRGQLQPGDRLVEADLAARLGISHIPLRESLVRLESEGLVRRVPNWATFVENFVPADALEIYQMRLLLEPAATRLAAIRGDQRLVKRLHRLCDKMAEYSEKDDNQKLDEADYQFHLTIVRTSGLSRLIRSYESCHIRVLAVRSEDGQRQASAVSSYAREHRRIIGHIAAHRPREAERAAHVHVQKAMRKTELLFGFRLDDPPT